MSLPIVLPEIPKELEFPFSFFPDELQDIIFEVSATYSYPVEYTCCSVLSAAATAIGNSNSVQIKSNWIEKPSLFIALIGSPGVNKSAPLDWAMQPIEKREKMLYRQYLDNLKEYDLLPDKEKKGEPVLTKTVISDATPEAVVQQLKLNSRGVLLLIDELSGFLNTFQRYSKGNDEQFYLSAWSGKPVIVDRKTSRSVRINDPVINIIGTIQPGVLEKSFIGKEENGFFDRWLLCYPKSAIKGYWADFDINPVVQAQYNYIIERLMDMELTIDAYDNITSNKMPYDIDAMAILKKWQKGNTDFINSSNDDVHKAIRAKIETYIHRFALIAELIKFGCSRTLFSSDKPLTIKSDSVYKAIDLCEYFIRSAIEIRTGDPTENLPSIYKQLIDVIPVNTEFTYQEFVERSNWLDIPESTAKKWLKRNTGKDKIFTKIKHGVYARE